LVIRQILELSFQILIIYPSQAQRDKNPRVSHLNPHLSDEPFSKKEVVGSLPPLILGSGARAGFLTAAANRRTITVCGGPGSAPSFSKTMESQDWYERKQT
jgi:hypothetical protein